MSETSPVRTILILAANPPATPALGLRDEYWAIVGAMGRARGGRRLHVVPAMAVTDDDLRRALLDHQPEIVHFSGHGTGRKGLVFEETGEPLLIEGEALADLFRLCSAHVRCVVLNACYSAVQAIGRHVEFVIGMSRAIGDAAAIKFSTGFYDALASGRPFAEAFQFGCNAISLKGIPESLTPVLMVRGQPGPPPSPAAQVFQAGQPIDPSLRELISLLDFRADMILSAFEREREDLDTAGRGLSGDQSRNLEIDQLAGRVEKAARLFAELHEKNKKALAERAFIRSHEITGQIRQLLEEVKSQVDWRVHGVMMSPCCYAESPPCPWWFAKDYPGVLPTQLSADPSVRSVAQGWATSGATAAGEVPLP
ncbi:MAG TPA: CHAT domain-containing protein [Gemmataceae bacterium]|nr:CHAT domain-containing protein [Gemmataceae bacterium]